MNELPAALNELRDIHAPPPVAWWPPAPGWWLIAGALVIAGISWVWWRKRERWRRAALRELARVEADYRHSGDALHLCAQLSALARRVALLRKRSAQIAALSGDAWLQFLDASGRMCEFTSGAGRVLATAPYAPHIRVDAPALTLAVRRWIKRLR